MESLQSKSDQKFGKDLVSTLIAVSNVNTIVKINECIEVKDLSAVCSINGNIVTIATPYNTYRINVKRLNTYKSINVLTAMVMSKHSEVYLDILKRLLETLNDKYQETLTVYNFISSLVS